MKLLQLLNHKLSELWRWNAAVGTRNEAAVVQAFGKVSPYFRKLGAFFIAFGRSWRETIEVARHLPWLFHSFVGVTTLIAHHLLTDGLPLPDNEIEAILTLCIYGFISPYASKVVMFICPQPYAWFANRCESVVDELAMLSR
jgi:hypothetical protein